jgi:predicted AlkP superfamily phosphohydrolase/phosphomutase
MGRVDWSTTRATCLVADLQGYVRFNVRGREAAGVVEPGAEYEQLVDEVSAGLATFVDADTGEPVVQETRRASELYQSGARRDLLPDLIVQWSSTPVAPQRAIVSSKYGTIDLPLPGKNPSGRGGNHRPHGFLIAGGPGIEPGSILGGDIMDLVPTAYVLLGHTPPESMRGHAIDLVTEGAIQR